MSGETENEDVSSDPTASESFGVDEPDPYSIIEQLRPVLAPLASLKIAVTMFACSLFLVMIGTLAQVDADIWDVVHTYFRCWFAWIPVRTVHPLFARIEWLEPIRDFFQGLDSEVGIWFPGGWLIGSIMSTNLAAAFLLRFRIQATGRRLVAGLVTAVIGLLGLALAVKTGDSRTGLQEAWIEWDTLWGLLKGLTVALLLMNIWGFIEVVKSKSPERLPLLFSGLALTVAGYYLFTPDKRIGDSSMRILWQLIKGEVPALVLLAGFILLFKKRGGVVLVHAGIALMMINEVIVHTEHVETQMTIREGETASYSHDVRSVELAIVDISSDPDFDTEVRIPRHFFDSTNATFVAHLAEDMSRSATEANVLAGTADSEKELLPQGTLKGYTAAVARMRRLPVNKETERLREQAVEALDPVMQQRGPLEELGDQHKKLLEQISDIQDSIAAADRKAKDDAAAKAEADRKTKKKPDAKAKAKAEKEVADAKAQQNKRKDELRETRQKASQLADRIIPLLPDFAKALTKASSAVEKLDEPLRQFVRSEKQLPFDLRIDRFMQNSDPRGLRRTEDNLATAGSGLEMRAHPVKAGVGTDTEGTIDLTSAYVTLIDKSTKEELGTYLLSIYFQLAEDPTLPPNMIEYDGKTWSLALRFHRYYKPYSVYLSDVSKKDYVGTSMARDFRSVVTITDEDGTSFERDIWMNNPLRYAGETFYQSNYTAANPRTGAPETTTLQVVRNTGWMIPYVACMIVLTGLSAHFWVVLVRFLNRRDASRLKIGILASIGAVFGLVVINRSVVEGASSSDAPEDDEVVKPQKPGSSPLAAKMKPAKPAADLADPDPPESIATRVVPWVLALCVGFWLLGHARTAKVEEGDADLAAFGELPLIYEGRMKPFDTLARNSLRILSNKTSFTLETKIKDDKKDDREKGRNKPAGNAKEQDPQAAETKKEKIRASKEPAIRWLLDVMFRPEVAKRHKVFRIENPQVQKSLGLEKRKGFLYALDEFEDAMESDGRVIEQIQSAGRKEEDDRSADERKLLEFAGKFQQYLFLRNSFGTVEFPPLPENLEREQRVRFAEELLVPYGSSLRRFEEDRQPPLCVPPIPEKDADEPMLSKNDWKTYHRCSYESFFFRLFQRDETSEPFELFEKINSAWKNGKGAKFNEAVRQYRKWLKDNQPADVDLEMASFETRFNHFAPSYYSAWSYLFAFMLTAFALLGCPKLLNRAAMLMIMVTFLVHTFALWARMEISGRPPVTNLYSSAVFIGWAGVLMGIAKEMAYRNGIGNVIASSLGAITLGIAYFLSGEGDTFKVLQAVLDTQFWLATHVVCITIGYSATFLAGLLGLVLVGGSLLTPFATRERRGDLVRMIFGTVCFGILFSFVGTVLGGLWADDSWGRFWGWDPKENGALLIVIWNALVLHACWDRQVGDRGLGLLVIVGNIITSWSWFGVNQLGVGLHSYGDSSGVWLALWVFWLSQLAFISTALIPRSCWTSFRVHGENRLEEHPVVTVLRCVVGVALPVASLYYNRDLVEWLEDHGISSREAWTVAGLVVTLSGTACWACFVQIPNHLKALHSEERDTESA